tara:strand:- start:249 stop:710 length:462 start_codon:yes stop_codon:yes gene_type:complete
MLIRLLLIIILLPIQSCTNTSIGEKLGNSFDSTDNQKKLVKTNNKIQKLKQKSKIESKIQENMKENEIDFVSNIKENSMSKSIRVSQKPIKSIKKTTFSPQPYRIILKLPGVNPSAPAETVTEALRKAGVQFEVEKIERFYEKKFSKDSYSKR